MFVLSHLPKAQLRAPLSPLQTAWTSFDSNLYSSGSSSAGPALVEIATARAGPAEDDPPLYKLGSKPVLAVCKGESGALN